MPDLAKSASGEAMPGTALSGCEPASSLLRENERLREKVAEIVLQLDALWKQFDRSDSRFQHIELCIARFHRDN